MSEKPNEGQEQIDAVLLDRVFIPRFVTKLAEQGLVVKTAEELDAVLEIAGKLQLLGATTQEKEAEASVADFLKAASATLDNVPAEGAEAPKPEADLEKAAAAALEDPEVLKAVKAFIGE